MTDSADSGGRASRGRAKPPPFWDLSGLYQGPLDPKLRADREKALSLAEAFARAYRNRIDTLATDPEALGRALSAYEEVCETALGPLLYATLLHASNTQRHEAEALLRKARSTWEEAAGAVLFFPLALRKAAAGHLGAWRSQAPLASYLPFLERQARWAPHTLETSRERALLRERLPGGDPLVTAYDTLFASLRFRLPGDGAGRERTAEELRGLLFSGNPRQRRESFLALHEGLKAHGEAFAGLLSRRVDRHRKVQGERGFQDPLGPLALELQVPPEVLDGVVDAVLDRWDAPGPYLMWKARRMGKGPLWAWDLYAPVEGLAETLQYDEAVEIILEALGRLDPLFSRASEDLFKEGRVHAAPSEGKRPGAFCLFLSPARPPYLSLHFTGSFRDLLVLAHEVGHAVHYTLSSRPHPLNFAPCPVLEEAAAIFAALWVLEHLLEKGGGGLQRKALLALRAEDALVTVFRQAALARFEKSLYETAQGGLSARDLCERWMSVQGALHGRGVRLPPASAWGWAAVPHFVVHPLYCYNYVLAYLTATALLRRCRGGEEAGAAGVVGLFRENGVQGLAAILGNAGVDPADPRAWARPLDEISSWLASPWEKEEM